MKAQVREKVTFMGWKMVVGFAFVFSVFILKKKKVIDSSGCVHCCLSGKLFGRSL